VVIKLLSTPAHQTSSSSSIFPTRIVQHAHLLKLDLEVALYMDGIVLIEKGRHVKFFHADSFLSRFYYYNLKTFRRKNFSFIFRHPTFTGVYRRIRCCTGCEITVANFLNNSCFTFQVLRGSVDFARNHTSTLIFLI
jgi:hypothetical protein